MDTSSLNRRLVHLYWQVTPAGLYGLLATEAEALERFCAELLAFLDRNPPQTS